MANLHDLKRRCGLRERQGHGSEGQGSAGYSRASHAALGPERPLFSKVRSIQKEM